jgi:hypothetical protein
VVLFAYVCFFYIDIPFNSSQSLLKYGALVTAVSYWESGDIDTALAMHKRSLDNPHIFCVNVIAIGSTVLVAYVSFCDRYSL